MFLKKTTILYFQKSAVFGVIKMKNSFSKEAGKFMKILTMKK